MRGSPLLEPLDLGARRSRNRIFFGPHETNLGRGRSVSDRHVAYYRRRAAGGAGVIVVEEASVHPSDWPYERCPLACESAEGWAGVARACREEGALALAALGHAGGQGSSAYSQAPLWAPSRVPEVASREVPKEMEPEDVGAVVTGFATAAHLAMEAGLDGVEVNAGQHSLIRQFCSALTNHRTDEWGADRSRFARQVLAALRGAVGPAVVGLRLCLDELAPWAGMAPDAGLALAAELERWVDYVAVVRGSIYSVPATRPDCHTEPGFNRDLARLARDGLPPRVAVVAQGSIVDPAMAAEMLESGVADAVEMTRAQVAEPDLGRLVAAGQAERARPCILCNQACQVRDVRNPVISCVGEPGAGHETEDPGVPAPLTGARPRAGSPSVLVVGGGPAGLECARVAVLGGCQVQLLERRPVLGGGLRAAALGRGRDRLAALVDWLEAECRAWGVAIHTGRQAGPDDIEGAARSGAVVVCCTGSVPGRRPWQLDEQALVVEPEEALAWCQGDARPGPSPARRRGRAGRDPGPVLVWDPVGGPIGISVAETLAGRGCQVTLATPDLVVGHELARSGDMVPANARLHAAGVALAKRSLLRQVGRDRAVLEDRFTAERRVVEAAWVVDAGYRLPNDALWRAAGGRPGVARAGDAVAPRTVYEAVLEGRRAALAILGVAVPAGPWVGTPAGLPTG